MPIAPAFSSYHLFPIPSKLHETISDPRSPTNTQEGPPTQSHTSDAANTHTLQQGRPHPHTTHLNSNSKRRPKITRQRHSQHAHTLVLGPPTPTPHTHLPLLQRSLLTVFFQYRPSHTKVGHPQTRTAVRPPTPTPTHTHHTHTHTSRATRTCPCSSPVAAACSVSHDRPWQHCLDEVSLQHIGMRVCLCVIV